MLKAEEQELLSSLAHQSWIERGKPLGSPEVDWERAKERLVILQRQRLAELDRAARPDAHANNVPHLPRPAELPADIHVVNAETVQENLQPIKDAKKRSIKKPLTTRRQPTARDRPE